MTYNYEKMNDFLVKKIIEYGITEEKTLIVTDEIDLLKYCDSYEYLTPRMDFYKYYNKTGEMIVLSHIDCSNMHATLCRKKVKDNPQFNKKIKLNSTCHIAGTIYPEIIFSIKDFLSKDIADFSIFTKYFNEDPKLNTCKIDFKIDPNCKMYNEISPKQMPFFLKDCQKFKKDFIKKIVQDRIKQSECLSEFYNLFDFSLEKKEDLKGPLAATIENDSRVTIANENNVIINKILAIPVKKNNILKII